MYDIVIIGAGVSGCMLAHKLARFKLKCAVVEAGCDVASGATRANSAIVHAGFDAENGTLKAKLNVIGCTELPKIAEQLDVPYKNNTSIVAAFSDEDVEKLRALYERGERNGVEGLYIAGRDEVHRLEPNLSSEVVAALVAPSAGIICPYELTIACAENAAINGCEFFFDRRVDRVVDNGDYVTVGAGDFKLDARYIVNAAGVHSDELARLADPDYPISLRARRGEYMILDKSEGSTCSSTIFTVPGKEGKGILVSPTVDGNIIVGPNAHEVERDDTSTTAAGLDEISRAAKRMFPNINLRAVITSFAGVRPTPSDGEFHIEPSKTLPRMLNLVGIESPGLASSPAVADYAINVLREMGVSFNEREIWYRYRRPDGHMPKLFRELSDSEKAELCKKDPAYGKIICRCETVTEGDILAAIHRPLGAKTIDMVKLRTRAGMGRCQGGFCSPRVADILSRELNIPLVEITKRGGESKIVVSC